MVTKVFVEKSFILFYDFVMYVTFVVDIRK